ncbi:response regulator transcription factor [Pontibacter pudoricolor]|uniref:response regulator transcription factor n=1 Tax=Pontibacter pudoricolor TaxID=2694930 RepID=UPI0013912F63|nr:helix-turn-helix transcriptional regulator [Pontibacter pudoricolor]
MERHVQILSDRERKVLALLADGYSEAKISSKMHISEQTVRKHIRNMLVKQGFVSPYQLINWAYKEAVIS